MTVPIEVRELYPFQPKRLTVQSGVEMSYVDEGSGSPLLMVHGNPTWSFFYRRVIREFAGPTHRCIAPDHVGMGLSDKPQSYPYTLAQHAANLEKLVLELDLRDIDMLVHDWGGAIGLLVASRHPDRFRRLVISNTAAFRWPDLPPLLRLARVRWIGVLLIRGLNAFVLTTQYTASARRDRLRGPVRLGYTFPYNSWANRIATARFVQDIPVDAKDRAWPALLELEHGLTRLSAKPTLLLWGERDWCFTPAMRDRFKDFFPQARSVGLASAHHLLYEDAPEECLAALRDFLL